ncbi:MAG TPA: amino acid permease [Steroidobacteraceae bacterium]|nr:amino acid permease [Steroidobacteraceae bacterium]
MSTSPESISDRESGLNRGLTQRQIVMIGLGGAIGTGLFMGSGIAIGYAGPAVIVSYLLAGFVAVVMVFSLSEMAVVHPTAGSFGTYAETYLNPWAGFVVRYTYWIAQVIAIGGESVAAGVYMTFWLPTVPVWIWSISFCVVLLYFNSRSVHNFGTIEFWFALIKVVAIVLFIGIGAATIFGVGTRAVGFHNLTELPGGFVPHGLTGLWMAVIVGVFSFNGIEVIAVTSGEADNPQRAIPAALRTMVLRLFLFYILSLVIIVATTPWTATGASVVSESPFVKVFSVAGVRDAAGIMNFVVLSAALSSMNTNVYLCSRMLFSLARGRYAPRFLGALSRSGTPAAAILVSGACILAAAAVSKLTPYAYNYLFGVALFAAMLVWIFILVSHLSFRRHHPASTLPVRMPFFPWMQIAGLAMLVALLITMGLDTQFFYVSWLCGVPWILAISAAYLLWRTRQRRTLATHAAFATDERRP